MGKMMDSLIFNSDEKPERDDQTVRQVLRVLGWFPTNETKENEELMDAIEVVLFDWTHGTEPDFASVQFGKPYLIYNTDSRDFFVTDQR